MCLNDWRAGRLVRSFGRILPANTDTVATLTPNPQRVEVIISQDNQVDNGIVFVTINGVDIPIVAFPTFGVIFKLDMASHGDLPTRQIKLTGNVANTGNFGIFEMTMPEEMIAACLEQFNREIGQCNP